MLLKIWHEKHVLELLKYCKVRGLQHATVFKKKTPVLVFSYEFCQIFNDIFFTEYFQVQAAGGVQAGVSGTKFRKTLKKGATNFFSKLQGRGTGFYLKLIVDTFGVIFCEDPLKIQICNA